MSETPASPAPGRDHNPRLVPPWPEWMDDPAYLALQAEDDDPGDPDLDLDPEDAPPPEVEDGELAAVADQITADQARLAAVAGRLGVTAALAAGAAAGCGRRGPGMPGSAQSFPGVYASRASGFASGKPLDTAPGCLVLGQFADEAAGDDDRYPGASDDELLGAVAAWDRVEAYASSRKHAAVAEVIRRRPGPGCVPGGPAQLPEAVDEFAARELGSVLGESSAAAADMLSLAHELEVNLPGTKAAFRAGILNQRKAAIIASATAVLDPDQARAAEALVLGRTGTLTPPGLRGAIARAVMEVAPGKAKQRREHEAKRTRVERWAEPSGNAGLAGRELPPAQALAADQRVTAWAKELRKAGLDGGIDALRARALMDILLGMDSRPLGSKPDGTRTSQPQAPLQPQPQEPASASAQAQTPGPGPGPGTGGPLAGMIPPGFAGHVNLTIPAATLTARADRPGELSGIGPVDPDPGANTQDRYQTGRQLNPALGRISVPDRCARTAVSDRGHAR